MLVTRAVIDALIARGTDLSPPPEARLFKLLEQKSGLIVGPDFREVYAQFNGFETHDQRSWLMLWSIETIVEQVADFKKELGTRPLVAIGDFLIHSDIIVAEIENRRATVKLLFEDRELASSIQEFVAKIAAGAFDWFDPTR